MRTLILASVLALSTGVAAAQTYLGQFSANPHAPQSTAAPAQRFAPDSVINPMGRYGRPTSAQSATNPFATDAPELYDSAGRYRGKLSANPYDPDSISNPYGRYGSRTSPDSVNNPYGAGNPYAPESPTNRFGAGLRIIGKD
ncbi:MAG: hypothetical protein AB7E79_15525 [Rhodospirillaceae bacterium]